MDLVGILPRGGYSNDDNSKRSRTTCQQLHNREDMNNGEIIQIGNIVDDSAIGFKNPQRGRIYDAKGLAPCLNCCGGGGLEIKIVEMIQDAKIIQRPRGFNKGGVKRIAPACTGSAYQENNLLQLVIDGKIRIRRLTPREYFRLMGVDDEDIDTIQSAVILAT